MAPIQNFYFPPLDQCFNGDFQLLSWHSAAHALTDPASARRNAFLQGFLADDTVKKTLSEPCSPLGQPSPDAKAALETRTAPSQITRSETKGYDVDEIKKDAIWLSGKMKIDEITALRIAVLEWQQRPVERLRDETSSDPSESMMLNSSIVNAPSCVDKTGLAMEIKRRHRILKICIREEASIVRIVEILVLAAMDRKHLQDQQTRIQGREGPSADETLGDDLLEKQESLGVRFQIKAIDRVDQLLNSLVRDTSFPGEDDAVSDIEEYWKGELLLQAIYMQKLILLHLFCAEGLTEGNLAVQWYRTMNKYAFFATWQSPYDSLSPLLTTIRTTVSLISLVILQLNAAILFLHSPHISQQPSTENYIMDTVAFNDIHGFITNIAAMGPSPATLATFAWLVIHYQVRNTRDEFRERVEAVETDIGKTYTDREIRVWRDCFERLDNISLNEEEMETLANYAVGFGRAHEVVADAASKLAALFSSPVDLKFQQYSRLRLLELISSSLGITRYDIPVINASLAVLNSQQDFWSFVDASAAEASDPVCTVFIGDREALRPLLLDVAQLRFPYETLPFLQLCRSLAVDIVNDLDQHELLQLLSNLPYFVQKLSPSFGTHELSREETEENYIRLTADLPIFQGTAPVGRSAVGKGSQLALIVAQSCDVTAVPAGTEGLNNGDMLITWNFQYDAIAYLTTLLSTAIRNSTVFEFATHAPASPGVAAEILSLFNTILAAGFKTTTTDPAEVKAVKLVLGSDSDESESPLIRIVFELFEQELQSQREQPGGDSLDLLIAASRTLYLITKIHPDKVWPFVSRSRYLETDGLAAIVAGTELVLGQYAFLRTSVRLYQALIDDAITNAVKRRTAGVGTASSRAVTRFGDVTAGRGSPEKIMNMTLLAFTRTFTNVLESMSGWRFANEEERLALNAEILKAFESILRYSYGYNDTNQLEQGLTAALADSARYLYETFGNSSRTELSVVPILSLIASGVATSEGSILFVSLETQWIKQTISAVRFAELILRINQLFDYQTTHLEAELFKLVPILVRLYAANDKYKSAVCELLTTLIKSAARNEQEPPSLLGHLNEDNAKAFLSILAQLGKPLNDLETEISIWNLASAIVSGRQSWFATLLLTGRTPREEVKTRNQKNIISSAVPGGRSLLAYALDELTKIVDLKPARSIAMLDFIMLSQSYWPWAMSTLRNHSHFLTEIQNFVSTLRPEDVQGSSEKTVLTAERYRMASLIAEILALYLHQSKQNEATKTFVKELIPRLSFLKRFAIASTDENSGSQQFSIPTYNANLHGNLERNFASRYPGIKLADFKCVLPSFHTSPKEYYYDMSFAKRLLEHSPGWTGRRNDGYAADFVRANINLYLVQAQVNVLKGWRMLAAELSSFAHGTPHVNSLLIKICQDCLDANINSTLPQTPLFERLDQVRVDLAFVLLQKLVQVKADGEAVQTLLSRVWDAIRASGHDFETAFMGDSADYYRSLLKLLFLALSFHMEDQLPRSSNPPPKPGSTALVMQTESILLEILSKVVGTGFRSLANLLHDNPSITTVPDDLILITALLQSILRVPALKLLHSQIALQFAGHNTVRYAISLFSWSDQLAAATNKDPIFAELSILFLLELSSIPTMAESMAVEGVLAGISTASITAYFRRQAGIGPLEPQGRMHTVWAKGILPICLNLLGAVGSPVAPEVGAFLNQFPGQLSRTVDIFGKTSVSPNEMPRYQVTLSMAAELHSLALIATILERLKKDSPNGSDIESLKFDRVVLKEDLEGWTRGRRGLMERIVPATDRDLRLSTTKAAAESSGETELEARVIAECKAAFRCSDAG